MKKLSLLISLILLLASCSKDPVTIDDYTVSDNGVFIVNEGNFGGGTGSLSFYSYSNDTIYNDLFRIKNGRPLGDVAFSMIIKGEREYIVVNNSGKIEVLNRNLGSVATITGLVSPRNIAFTGENKAYVTSMYSDSLAILNTLDNSVSGYINMRRTSESIVKTGTKAYVANWVGGNEIMVINTLTDRVVDSVQVGFEPESMAIDKDGKLWVLCNGGWMREHFAEMIRINTTDDEIEQRFVFPSISDSPSCLQTDGAGENLFYLEKGVRKMAVSASGLPATALIPETGTYFYKTGVNPVNGDIFVTDAADYQQNGNVIRYSKEGLLISSLKADIIPAFLCFRMNNNSVK